MNKTLRIIHYIITAFLLSTSVIYFVVTYQQFTDESGNGIHEIAGQKEIQQGTSDLDKSQWSELDLGGKIQTLFFLVAAIAYIPVGIWMIKQKYNEKPHFIALIGSLSLILFYVMSRAVSLPVVGIQTDIGSVDIIVKILQGGIIIGSSYLIMTRRKLENKSTAN